MVHIILSIVILTELVGKSILKDEEIVISIAHLKIFLVEMGFINKPLLLIGHLLLDQIFG